MSAKLLSTRIRDLGLKIEGTWLEPVIAEFQRELVAAGLEKVKPHFYLTWGWVVVDDTIGIGIPLYLAHPGLMDLHADLDGFYEGRGKWDLLRYLRHEMGHVVNYAYQLYQRKKWTRLFGPMETPYPEEYYPAQPFSRRYVVHLPGWYAQKHPDEDWAETFAVWLTPGFDWRAAYAEWPKALKKLEYCDRLMGKVRDRDPAVTDLYLKEEACKIRHTVAGYYRSEGYCADPELQDPWFDVALQTVFGRLSEREDRTRGRPLSAARLIRQSESTLVADLFRWTGQYTGSGRDLLRRLAERAAALNLTYPADREHQALLGLATLVTALSMNYVEHDAYLPRS